MRNRLMANSMPKEPLIFLVFLFMGILLSAQDAPVYFDDGEDFPEAAGEEQGYRDFSEEPGTPEKEQFRFKNRTAELRIANIGFDFSNNFIAVSDMVRNPFDLLVHINDVVQDSGLIWKDPVVVNLDYFFDGFKFNIGAAIKPLSFNFNRKDMWGFGLDIAHVDVTGNFSLSGNMVTLSEAGEDKFGVGAAIFVDAGIPVFFHYRDFKIKIRPAVYVPAVYSEPIVTYTFAEADEGTRYEINYDMKIYSLVKMMEETEDGMDAMFQLTMNNLGYDFGLNVEYPWSYDLDLGVNIVNIPVPFAAARLNHYLQFKGSVWVDTDELDVTDLVKEDGEGNTKDIGDLKGTAYDYPDDFILNYDVNTDGKKIYRPFSMVFYANYRPYESPILTLVPSLGFSINYLYPTIASIEGGLYARFDKANIFITTLGINYNDRRWVNSVDLILNLRAFEFNMGISLQSQKFVRSWQGAGLGVYFGFIFGW